MIEALPLNLGLGFAIGLSLGLLGGGGSILTVPALVYLVGQTPQAAVTTSLAIVAANSALGAFFHHRFGRLNWPVAVAFGGTGMAIAYLAAGLSSLFSPPALLVIFALFMLFVGSTMIWYRVETPQDQDPKLNWLLVLASGAGVGLLTGILGVGGGFLIVPALVMVVGLPVYQAVGTSLVVIAANSLAGFLGHLGDGYLNLTLTLVFVAAGLGGTFAGSRLANRLPAEKLKRAFAVFVILLGLFLLFDNLPVVWA